MNKKHAVRLIRVDRRRLEGVVRRRRDSATKVARARILRKSDVRTGG